jgi:hypothetical protein
VGANNENVCSINDRECAFHPFGRMPMELNTDSDRSLKAPVAR